MDPRKRKNRDAIRDYFQRNPLARQQECAKDLGLGLMAVSRHVRELREEWLREREDDREPAK